MFSLIVSVLTMIILLNFLPLIQDRYHTIKYVGICVGASKFDIHYGVGMSAS